MVDHVRNAFEKINLSEDFVLSISSCSKLGCFDLQYLIEHIIVIYILNTKSLYIYIFNEE